jgi:hypothetical protein
MLVVPQSSVFMVVAIVFALIAHPKTYLLVHKLSKMIGGPNVVTPYGVSTTTGLLAHALVAALVAVIFFRFL